MRSCPKDKTSDPPVPCFCQLMLVRIMTITGGFLKVSRWSFLELFLDSVLRGCFQIFGKPVRPPSLIVCNPGTSVVCRCSDPSCTYFQKSFLLNNSSKASSMTMAKGLPICSLSSQLVLKVLGPSWRPLITRSHTLSVSILLPAFPIC